MAELIDFESKPDAADDIRDQRRPGRREFVDPNLIPLLRQQPLIPDLLVETVDPGEFLVEPGRRATLSAARGISLGVALGTLIWLCAGIGIWLYLKG